MKEKIFKLIAIAAWGYILSYSFLVGFSLIEPTILLNWFGIVALSIGASDGFLNEIFK